MYCSTCATHVRTETEWIDEQADADQYDTGAVNGDFPLEDVGTLCESVDGEWMVTLRVDTCTSCGRAIRLQTYLKEPEVIV